MRTLFVFMTMAEAQAFQDATGYPKASADDKNLSRISKVVEFTATEGSGLIVPLMFINTGFNLPADTHIILSKSIREKFTEDDAEIIQLRARVGRVRPKKENMIKVTSDL